jgi:hypothetical protein
LLELLLERSKLCKGRIGIRLFVAAVGSMWLRKILLALRAADPFISIAARPFATWAAIVSFAALALTLHPLLPLMAVLTLLAVRAIAVVTWTARAGRRLSSFRSGRCIDTFCRQGRDRRAGLGYRNLRLLRTLRAARSMRAPFGTTSRPPNLDEGRLLGRLAFNRTRLSGIFHSRRGGHGFDGHCFRLCSLFRCGHLLLHQWCSSGCQEFRLRQQ